MTTEYQELKAVIEVEIDRLRFNVSDKYTAAVIRSDFFESERFFLRGYISFSLFPGEELFVVSIDCKKNVDLLTFECDLSEGNGNVLDDGPSASVTMREVAIGGEALSNWISKLRLFLDKSEAEIIKGLADKARP